MPRAAQREQRSLLHELACCLLLRLYRSCACKNRIVRFFFYAPETRPHHAEAAVLSRQESLELLVVYYLLSCPVALPLTAFPARALLYVTLAGLEPAIFGSEDQRLIH